MATSNLYRSGVQGLALARHSPYSVGEAGFFRSIATGASYGFTNYTMLGTYFFEDWDDASEAQRERFKYHERRDSVSYVQDGKPVTVQGLDAGRKAFEEANPGALVTPDQVANYMKQESERYDRSYTARATSNISNTVGFVLGTFAGNMASPEILAVGTGAAFIPVRASSVAKKLAKAGHFKSAHAVGYGKRGLIQGAVASVAATPFVMHAQSRLGKEYGAEEFLLDTAMGSLANMGIDSVRGVFRGMHYRAEQLKRAGQVREADVIKQLAEEAEKNRAQRTPIKQGIKTRWTGSFTEYANSSAVVVAGDKRGAFFPYFVRQKNGRVTAEIKDEAGEIVVKRGKLRADKPGELKKLVMSHIRTVLADRLPEGPVVRSGDSPMSKKRKDPRTQLELVMDAMQETLTKARVVGQANRDFRITPSEGNPYITDKEPTKAGSWFTRDMDWSKREIKEKKVKVGSQYISGGGRGGTHAIFQDGKGEYYSLIRPAQKVQGPVTTRIFRRDRGWTHSQAQRYAMYLELRDRLAAGSEPTVKEAAAVKGMRPPGPDEKGMEYPDGPETANNRWNTPTLEEMGLPPDMITLAGLVNGLNDPLIKKHLKDMGMDGDAKKVDGLLDKIRNPDTPPEELAEAYDFFLKLSETYKLIPPGVRERGVGPANVERGNTWETPLSIEGFYEARTTNALVFTDRMRKQVIESGATLSHTLDRYTKGQGADIMRTIADNRRSRVSVLEKYGKTDQTHFRRIFTKNPRNGQNWFIGPNNRQYDPYALNNMPVTMNELLTVYAQKRWNVTHHAGRGVSLRTNWMENRFDLLEGLHKFIGEQLGTGDNWTIGAVPADISTVRFYEGLENIWGIAPEEKIALLEVLSALPGGPKRFHMGELQGADSSALWAHLWGDNVATLIHGTDSHLPFMAATFHEVAHNIHGTLRPAELRRFQELYVNHHSLTKDPAHSWWAKMRDAFRKKGRDDLAKHVMQRHDYASQDSAEFFAHSMVLYLAHKHPSLAPMRNRLYTILETKQDRDEWIDKWQQAERGNVLPQPLMEFFDDVLGNPDLSKSTYLTNGLTFRKAIGPNEQWDGEYILEDVANKIMWAHNKDPIKALNEAADARFWHYYKQAIDMGWKDRAKLLDDMFMGKEQLKMMAELPQPKVSSAFYGLSDMLTTVQIDLHLRPDHLDPSRKLHPSRGTPEQRAVDATRAQGTTGSKFISNLLEKERLEQQADRIAFNLDEMRAHIIRNPTSQDKKIDKVINDRADDAQRIAAAIRMHNARKDAKGMDADSPASKEVDPDTLPDKTESGRKRAINQSKKEGTDLDLRALTKEQREELEEITALVHDELVRAGMSTQDASIEAAQIALARMGAETLEHVDRTLQRALAMKRVQAQYKAIRERAEGQAERFKVKSKDGEKAVAMGMLHSNPDYMTARSFLLADNFNVSQDVSMDTRIRAVQDETMGRMPRLVEAARSKWGGFVQNHKAFEDVVRVLYGEEIAGDAKVMAEEVRGVLDYLYNRFNDAGGDVRYLEDYRVFHSHNQDKMLKAGYEAWRDYISERIDLDRIMVGEGADATTASPAQREIFLKQMFKDITEPTYQHDPLGVGRMRQFKQLADFHQLHRQIHYKDADSYLEYLREFGNGTAYQTFMSGMHSRTMQIGMLEQLGPNPDETMAWIMNAAYKGGLTSWEAQSLLSAWHHILAEASLPENRTMADWGRGFRQLGVSANMGSAVVLALFGDVGTTAMALSHTDVSGLGAILQHIKTLNWRSPEDRRLANSLFLSADYAISTLGGSSNRFADIEGAGITGMLSEATVRLQGLTRLTQNIKEAVKMETNWTFTQDRHLKLKDLSEWKRKVLKSYGINDVSWDVIRAADTVDFRGKLIFNPAKIADQDVRTRWLGLMDDLAERAVPSPTNASKSFLIGNYKPGTPYGELKRSFAMFLSYPASLGLYHLRHSLYNADTGLQGAAYVGGLFGTMTMLGAIGLAAYEVLNGRDPPDYTEPKTWLGAAHRGGGLGFLGDFVFQDVRYTGASDFVSELAGPVGKGVEDLAVDLTLDPLRRLSQGEDTKYMQRVARFAEEWTPFSSLWYAKAFFDQSLFYWLRQQTGRQQKRPRGKYENRYWYGGGGRIREPRWSQVIGA